MRVKGEGGQEFHSTSRPTRINKSNVNHIIDDHGNTALLLAINSNDPKLKGTIEKLIKWGADVNAENNFGHTPLIIASINEQIDIIDLLLDNGALVNKQNNYGETALIRASRTDYYHPINFEVNDPKQRQELQLRECSLDIIQRLIDAGADTDIQDENKKTATERAILTGKYDAALLLITNLADPNICQTNLKTQLEDIENPNDASQHLLNLFSGPYPKLYKKFKKGNYNKHIKWSELNGDMLQLKLLSKLGAKFNFANQSLVGLDLSGIKLNQPVLKNTDFSDVDLTDTDLSDLTEQDIQNCKWDRAKISAFTFTGRNLYNNKELEGYLKELEKDSQQDGIPSQKTKGNFVFKFYKKIQEMLKTPRKVDTIEQQELKIKYQNLGDVYSTPKYETAKKKAATISIPTSMQIEISTPQQELEHFLRIYRNMLNENQPNQSLQQRNLRQFTNLDLSDVDICQALPDHDLLYENMLNMNLKSTIISRRTFRSLNPESKYSIDDFIERSLKQGAKLDPIAKKGGSDQDIEL